MKEDIPNSVKESSGLDAEHPYRVDVLWHYLKDIKKPGTTECESLTYFSELLRLL